MRNARQILRVVCFESLVSSRLFRVVSFESFVSVVVVTLVVRGMPVSHLFEFVELER